MKIDEYFCPYLSQITGVDEKILLHLGNLSAESVARRTTWASQRKTTRIEDMVQCLVGIFDVNMPMLNDEGQTVFIRLQEEPMKQQDDHSLFAWISPQATFCTGLLAESPSYFADSGSIDSYGDESNRNSYSMTNQGLRIDLHLTPSGEDSVNIAALDS